MNEKINVVDRPPYKAWRVNFYDQLDRYSLIFTAVIDAPDRDAAWQIVRKHYETLHLQFATFVERELRQPSEWEKPLP
jgi:hypothetical protein